MIVIDLLLCVIVIFLFGCSYQLISIKDGIEESNDKLGHLQESIDSFFPSAESNLDTLDKLSSLENIENALERIEGILDRIDSNTESANPTDDPSV
jgi:hypothetical protein